MMQRGMLPLTMVGLGHAVGWSLKLSVDSGGWLVAMRVNYFASFLCMADG